jgi:CYTH domain-containing protein
MPIENERKFVLSEDGRLERELATAPGVTRSLLRQTYLDAQGVRLRSIETGEGVRHIFSFKRTVDGEMVEIETDIEREDFDRLWKLGREKLRKVRYSWPDGRFHWDTDFFKTDGGRTYFALAEVEMPAKETAPPPVHARLTTHYVAAVEPGDPRFTSKRLADQGHAERLLAEIMSSHK